jgi:hypothetical protein
MSDFCDKDTGFDYVFGRLSANYGAPFSRHWDGIDPNMIRQEWINQLGIYLTYRPMMDYAINCCNPDFPPSALKFKELCNKGPAIPKGDAIEYRPRLVPMPAEVKAKMEQLKVKWKMQ